MNARAKRGVMKWNEAMKVEKRGGGLKKLSGTFSECMVNEKLRLILGHLL